MSDELTLKLPDGSLLAAKKIDDPDYPRIAIYLRGISGDDEILCFAELDRLKPKGQELCIGVYTADVDEPVYYGSYQKRRET